MPTEKTMVWVVYLLIKVLNAFKSCTDLSYEDKTTSAFFFSAKTKISSRSEKYFLAAASAAVGLGEARANLKRW